MRINSRGGFWGVITDGGGVRQHDHVEVKQDIVGMVVGAQMITGVGIGIVVGWGNVIAGMRVVVEGPGIIIVGEGVRVGK